MTFPLGKPILLMLIAALASGVVILLRPAEEEADLVVWTFADSHARSFRDPISRDPPEPSLIERFHEKTGQSVAVKLIGGQALAVKMNAIFDRDQPGQGVPDLVEIEMGVVGRYFRPPIKHIGFLPLNDRLKRDGLLDRLLEARLAPWSKDGVIFGVPRDVHPVTITYRRDLYDQAGVDLASAKTWPEFQEKCLAFQSYWAKNGHPNRRAIELPRANSEAVDVMLLQRHINLLGADNRPNFTEPRVARTIAFYARCVAGPRAIGGEATPGSNAFIHDFERGDLCALITPDWRAGYIPTTAPALRGKIAMMPLPRFDPTDSPTSTRGGTAIGIPKHARDPENSWELLKHLYFSDEGMKARRRHTGVLPPLIDAWADPIWHEPDPFYGGQKIGRLYIAQARELPRRHVTPFSSFAQQALSVVTGLAAAEVDRDGGAELDRKLAVWCAEADAEIRKRIDFGRFE